MNYYIILGLTLFGYMNLWFLISLIVKKNDIADMAWGLGFVLIAWVSLILNGTMSLLGLTVCTLVSIWGMRLAWHIFLRNKGKAEDYRYLAWRKKWGKWFYIRSYVQVYLLQGFLLYIIALPIIILNQTPSSNIGIFAAIGIAVWILGFAFEAIGDAQLAKFIKDPKNKGKLMQSGLWQYTRHPNYFGEVTMWWGIWLISLTAPNGWIAIIGPLTITFLILKVSGIPMLEKKMSDKPGFDEYKKRVSSFFPLPPKPTKRT